MGGNQQYVQHDWSNLTYVLLFTGMVLFVVLLMGLFLFMVGRACQATGSRPEVQEPAGPALPEGERPKVARPLAEASTSGPSSTGPSTHTPAGHPPAA